VRALREEAALHRAASGTAGTAKRLTGWLERSSVPDTIIGE
jgi:hypothetical protein